MSWIFICVEMLINYDAFYRFTQNRWNRFSSDCDILCAFTCTKSAMMRTPFFFPRASSKVLNRVLFQWIRWSYRQTDRWNTAWIKSPMLSAGGNNSNDKSSKPVKPPAGNEWGPSKRTHVISTSVGNFNLLMLHPKIVFRIWVYFSSLDR